MRTLTKVQIPDLVVKEGKFIAVGVYLDSTAEFKTGVSNKTGKGYTIRHSVTLIKFGDREATSCFQDLPDEAAVKSFKSSPKPFKIGDLVAVSFTQAYEENFKPAMRVEEYFAYTS